MESVDYTIIGGGVIGLAIGYYLTQQYPSAATALFERNKYLGEEQSGRNSGVLDVGHLYRHDSLKTRLCPKRNRMLARFALAKGIAYFQMGKMTIAEEAIKLMKK
ncbi:FAD-dependent oxidoreductase [Candidatus Woesearchaeota archaeon]|nr:FAD-dependent oxidoreductase [Candidatus Woesearchaeota archaeon]